MASGAGLAWAHPLSPAGALSVFYATLVLLAFKPRWWLFLVPAALPVLNFFPWSGWLMVEEFDLLLLCVFAAGYGRMAWQGVVAPVGSPMAKAAALDSPLPDRRGPRWPAASIALIALIALLGLFSMASAVRGFSAGGIDQALAQIQQLGLFQDYSGPLNSLRLFKSLAFALLCMPLLQRELSDSASRAQAFNLLGAGVLSGLALVVAVVLWERLAYPGLFNFSTRYRTTAMFWEMHVGGAAIDAYLTMAAPFLVWALAQSRKLRHWLPLALLALLTCYAVLTTFSRGVYLAVVLPLALLALGRWMQKTGLDWRRPLGQVWRRRATGWLVTLLVAEILVVALGGRFLGERLAQSEDDLNDRLQHWRRGISLLETPADWLLGIGLGRFPAKYAGLGEDTEFSGGLELMRETPPSLEFRAVPPINLEQSFVRLSGPVSNPAIGGLYMLNQRLDAPIAQWLKQAGQARKAQKPPNLGPAPAFSLTLQARASQDTLVRVRFCEKHLLYEGECLVRQFNLRGAQANWQAVVVPLRGAGLEMEESPVAKGAVLSVSVVSPGATIDIRHLQVADPGGRLLVANPNFTQGLAHWFPSASSYYLPWHVDNLYLELLIERGLTGLGLFLLVAGVAFRRLVLAPAETRARSSILLASISGALLLGLVSSVLDAPRVAFLLFFLIFSGIQLASVERHA